MARKPRYQYPVVEITWIDAETGHGWEEHSESDATLPIAITLGFLIHETEDAFVIASTYAGTSVNSRIKIPRGMIKQFTILK